MPDLVPHVLPAGARSRHAQPVLPAGGLVLRPVEPDDAPALVGAKVDPGVQPWDGPRLTRRKAETYAAEWAEHWRAECRAGWAVARGEQLVGRSTVRGIDHRRGSGEVTSWVVAAVRGTGVAPAAVDALCTWAVGEAGFHRPERQDSTRRPDSCRVAEKRGSALEGTKRSSLLHDDGRRDMHLHDRVSPR